MIPSKNWDNSQNLENMKDMEADSSSINHILLRNYIVKVKDPPLKNVRSLILETQSSM